MKDFIRKVSFGIGPEEKVPTDPLNWAKNQLNYVPQFKWGGKKIYTEKELREFLNKYDISSNKVSANFLLLDFSRCKLKAKYFYKRLKMKGIILRSTEEGYKIKNMLRLTIGSRTDSLRFIKAVKEIFKR